MADQIWEERWVKTVIHGGTRIEFGPEGRHLITYSLPRELLTGRDCIAVEGERTRRQPGFVITEQWTALEGIDDFYQRIHRLQNELLINYMDAYQMAARQVLDAKIDSGKSLPSSRVSVHR